jgi:hypothetical protein
MRKKITILALMLCLTSPATSFAETNYQDDISNTKVAVLEDVIKGVIKDTLFSVGSQVLNKYTDRYYNYTPSNNTNTNTNPTNSSSSNSTSNGVYYNYNTNSSNTYGASSGDFVPSQDPPPEEMIPIS